MREPLPTEYYPHPLSPTILNDSSTEQFCLWGEKNGSFTFRFDRMSFLFNMYDVLTRWILMTVQIDIMYFALGRTCTLVQSDHDTRCLF